MDSDADGRSDSQEIISVKSYELIEGITWDQTRTMPHLEVGTWQALPRGGKRGYCSLARRERCLDRRGG